MAEHSDIYLKDSKEPLTVTPVSLDYLVENYPDNIDLEIMDYFGIKNKDVESICESDLPEEVKSVNWARRVRYFWIAFSLQMSTYPIHVLVFLLSGSVKHFNVYAAVVPSVTFVPAFASIFFQLNGHQYLSEGMICMASGFNAFIGVMLWVGCLLFEQEYHTPEDVQYPSNPLFIWLLIAAAAISLVSTRIVYLGHHYKGGRSLFGVPELDADGNLPRPAKDSFFSLYF